jgi:hypothetical protein
MGDTLATIPHCKYPASVKHKAAVMSQQLTEMGLEADMHMQLLPLAKKLKRWSEDEADEELASKLSKMLHDLRVMRSNMMAGGSPEDEYEDILALGEKPANLLCLRTAAAERVSASAYVTLVCVALQILTRTSSALTLPRPWASRAAALSRTRAAPRGLCRALCLAIAIERLFQSQVGKPGSGAAWMLRGRRVPAKPSACIAHVRRADFTSHQTFVQIWVSC